jgi:hypothetical protein
LRLKKAILKVSKSSGLIFRWRIIIKQPYFPGAMVGAKLGIGGVPTQQNNEKKTNRCFEMPHSNKSIHLTMH